MKYLCTSLLGLCSYACGFESKEVPKGHHCGPTRSVAIKRGSSALPTSSTVPPSLRRVGSWARGLTQTTTKAETSSMAKISSLVFAGYLLCCLSQHNLFLDVRKACLMLAGLHSLPVHMCQMHTVLPLQRCAALYRNPGLQGKCWSGWSVPRLICMTHREAKMQQPSGGVG